MTVNRFFLLVPLFFEFLYFYLSLTAMPYLFMIPVAFPAIFILPGVMLLTVLKKGPHANAMQLVVGGFFISTVLAVVATSILLAVGLSLTPFAYSVISLSFISILAAIGFAQKVEMKPSKYDILLLTSAFTAFVILTFFLSAFPRLFTPDETSYIFSARMGLLIGGVPPMGVMPSYSGLVALLDGRYFWIYLLTSFLGSAGVPAIQAGLIGVGFLVMIALTSSLFMTNKWLRLLVFVAVVFNPLLFSFSGLTLNDLAFSFYAIFAVFFFVKAFSKTGENVSLNLANSSFALISVIVLTLIKPNLLVVGVMWVILVSVMLWYRVYKQSRKYKFLLIAVLLPVLAYELCIDLPYVFSVWVLRNSALGNFFARFLFISPIEKFTGWFVKPWWNPSASTLFNHGLSDYIAYFYRILTPESSGLLISAIILAIPILIISRDVRKELDKTILTLLVLLSLCLFYFQAISQFGLSDANRYSLWMTPLWIPLALMTLQEIYNNSSFKRLLPVIVTALVLLWSNIWLFRKYGGVYVGYGLPSLVTADALLAQFMGMIVLISLLFFKEDLSEFGSAIGKKLSALKAVNLKKTVFCFLIVLMFANSVYFAPQFVEKSSLYANHGFATIGDALGNFANNGSLIFANNYIFMRPYMTDKMFEDGMVLPPPDTEQEFLNLLQVAPDNTVFLISKDQATTWYEYANNYIKSYADHYIITSQSPELMSLAQFNLSNDVLHMTFDSANNTFVPDLSTSENNGLNRGAQIVSGYSGSALQFNGTAYVAIPNNDTLNIQNTISISLLASIEKAEPNQGYTLLSKGYAPTNGSYTIFIWDSQIYFELSSTNYLAFPISEYLGQWHHFIFTYDGEEMSAFVDGVSVATKPATGPIRVSPYDLEIGRDSEREGYYFIGLIDDLQISNKPLNQTELAESAYSKYALRIAELSLPNGVSELFRIVSKEEQVSQDITVKTSSISIDQNRIVTLEVQIESSKSKNATILVATDRFTKVYVTPVNVGLNSVKLQFDYIVDPNWYEGGGLYWLHLDQTRLIVIDGNLVSYNKFATVQNLSLMNITLLALLLAILVALLIIYSRKNTLHDDV